MFGNTLDDTHRFTGSLLLTGSNHYITGSISVSGSVSATAFYELSDIRYKDIISTNPQIDLTSLDVIEYKLKGDDQKRFGYPAQDVQNICGDLVVGENPLTINYSDLHTLKIHHLENKIKELETKIESLYAKVNSMDRNNG